MIQELSEIEVVTQLKKFRDQEVTSVINILQYLAEVKDRRLAQKRGYSSIYEFCRSELDYSKDETYARIRAMELVMLSPLVIAYIERRKLGITCLKQAQVAFNRENKRRRKNGTNPLTTDDKMNVLEKIAGSTTREVRRVLVDEFPLLQKAVIGQTPLPNGGTLFACVADAEQTKKILRFRDVVSARLNEFEPIDIFMCAVNIALKITDPLYEKPVQAAPKKESASAGKAKPVVAKRTTPRKYISVHIRRAVDRRANGRCEYIDEETGRRCECTWGLETDHIIPLACGGTDELENLRKCCKSHNLYAAEQWGLKRPV